MPDINAPRSTRERKVKIVLRHIFTSLSTIVLAFALAWGVARPHAQDFIKDTVKDQNFATKQQLDVIEERIRRLETNVQGVEGKVEDQGIRQTRIETVIQNLEELAREQRADMKELLRRR